MLELYKIYKNNEKLFNLLNEIYKYDSITIKRGKGEESMSQETGARKRNARYRAQKIMDAALELFCEKGIEETAIDEIAVKAGVGSATVYRYFETKAELAIQCGVAYWKEVAGRCLDMTARNGYPEMNGMEQLECIMEGMVSIFEHETGFLKYLQEFDVFVRRYGIAVERLREYEDCIMSLKPPVIAALEKGKEDGTMAFQWTPEEVCYSLAHSIFGLMKKLAWNGDMLKLDKADGGILQVRITIALLLRGLGA